MQSSLPEMLFAYIMDIRSDCLMTKKRKLTANEELFT